MEKIFHYTSNLKWKQIKQDGVLKPLSNPLKTPVELSERLKSMFGTNKYLVGLENPNCKGWREYGLMDLLYKRTTDEVILAVPILELNCFVREHMHLTPKYTMEKYGVDIVNGIREKIIPQDDIRFIDSVKAYFESAVPMKDYNGSFIVPEIWLAQTTPIDKIDVVSIK